MILRVFTLYDSDGDGVIHRSEIRDVIMAAYRMGGRHPGKSKDFFCLSVKSDKVEF